MSRNEVGNQLSIENKLKRDDQVILGSIEFSLFFHDPLISKTGCMELLLFVISSLINENRIL